LFILSVFFFNRVVLAQVVVDPPKVSSTDSLINTNPTKQERNESPMAQVRSYVEKQMDQLQQDLEFGFPRTPKTPLSSSSTNLLTNTARVFRLCISISSLIFLNIRNNNDR
jgi:hypothetical protein